MKRNSLVIILNILVLLFANISCDIMPMDSNNSKHKPPEVFEIQIEKTHNTFQGLHEYINVTVNKGTEDMLGFDLLIGYDASALLFQAANPGQIFEECEWEYFTYRYGASGDCDGNCPSGMIRIVGIAETNNGPDHPTCYGPTPFTLCTIDFLVTDDRIYECVFVPIRFFWTDCGDNAVLYRIQNHNDYDPYSDILGISRYVYDFIGAEITDNDYGFPWYFGAPTVPCMEGDNHVPTRYVDYINGGIDIICNDSIEMTGDLNLNGIAHEIADAVLYINYFVYGIGVFTNYQAQVSASDVNRDGLTLSVADLVYLINIVRGDALPYEDVQGTDTAQVYINNDYVNITGIEMGAAYIVLEGNVAPQLLYDQMEIKYSYDQPNNVTRVLIYSFDGVTFSGGNLLNLNGSNIISIELATAEGKRVYINSR